MTGVDTVEAEVRELVRRRGLDPIEDRAAVRRLVDEVVADYDERSLTSTLAPLSDVPSAARAVYDAVAGFGPLQRHLDDPSVEELWINERLTAGSRELQVPMPPVGDLANLHLGAVTARPRQSSIPCDERAVQRLGQGDVGGIVGRDAVSELECAASQRIGRRPALHGQVLEVGQQVLCPSRAQVPAQGEPPQRGDDFEVHQARCVQVLGGQMSAQLVGAG